MTEKKEHPLFWEYYEDKGRSARVAVDPARCRVAVYPIGPIAFQCSRKARVFCKHGVGYCTQHAKGGYTCEEREDA